MYAMLRKEFEVPKVHRTGLLQGFDEMSVYKVTPVATRMLRSPALNLLSAPNRLGWLIWPWIGRASKPKFLSMRASFLVLSQVLVKIMKVDPASSFM